MSRHRDAQFENLTSFSIAKPLSRKMRRMISKSSFPLCTKF